MILVPIESAYTSSYYGG